MELDGEQRELLRDALADIFPHRPDLEMMVSFRLNVALAAIAEAGDHRYTVFQLIRWAVAQNRVEELVRATMRYNNRDPRILEIAEILSLPPDTPVDPNDPTVRLNTISFDFTPCRDASLADINDEVVTIFSQKERVHKQLGSHSNLTNQELLEHIGLLREGRLTYGTVLCFGKNPSKWVVGAFTRCTSWIGNDRIEGWKEDQEFHRSLLQQYDLSMGFLQKSLCVIGAQGESIEQWEIPPIVLREALANALIHREYADQHANQINWVRVEIFDNRIEISSPGNLPRGLTISQLGRETHYRNPQVARIFQLCNHVERCGIGIDHMREEMRNARLSQPQFYNKNGTFKVELCRPRRVKANTSSFPSLLSLVKAVVSNRRFSLISLALVILLVTTCLIFAIPWYLTSTAMGIGVITEAQNEQIGLSDGTHAFDIGSDRTDASLKIQAAAKLVQGDKPGATSLWNQVVGIDTSDAEALIYLEDQKVLGSGSPYITLVVGTILTGNDISGGRDDLQGAYVAQKEYNDGLKLSGGRQIRLLIANAGSKPDYVTEVAGQIVQAEQQDSTIVGVMGWSHSAYAHKAIDVLSGAHIPMVSSTASDDKLSGISPDFFRVAPTNNSQAIAGTKYAEQQLHASRVALFVDRTDPYSRNLADDFEKQFVAPGNHNQIVDTEKYTVGDKASLPSDLQNALNSNPDLIYFSGYADDLAVLLANFPTSLPNLQVLGGDGLYTPNAYPSSAKPGFSHVRFTTFAYPDEWRILKMNEPRFFSEYPADFNPAGADHNAKPYGFTRADFGVILAYDATYALLQGCQNVLEAKNALTSDSLRYGLTQVTGAKAIQGVSGQISFGSDGDPINKVVVTLSVDPDDHIQLHRVQGCFVLGQCG